MLQAARKKDATGVNVAFVDDPHGCVDDWAARCFPELSQKRRDGIVQNAEHEGDAMYRMLCLEDDMMSDEQLAQMASSSAVMEAARAARKEQRQKQPNTKKDLASWPPLPAPTNAPPAAPTHASVPPPAPTHAAPPAAPTRPSAPPPAPTHASVPPPAPTQPNAPAAPTASPWVKKLEQLDAAPAPSAPSPLPPRTTVPAARTAPAVTAAETDPMQESLAFMQFQGEMEQMIGTEGQRDESAALKQLLTDTGFNLGFEPEMANAPLMINEHPVRRHHLNEPPGFELDDDMNLTQVYPGTAADRAGMKATVGQRLVQVNGVFIMNAAELMEFYAKDTHFTLGFMDMKDEDTPPAPTSPLPPSPPAPPTEAPEEVVAPPSQAKEMPFGFVFVSCPKAGHATLGKVLEGLIEMSDVTNKEMIPAYNGCLLMFSSSSAAEIAAQSVHGTTMPGVGNLTAHMVWPLRGERAATDIVARIGFFDINITQVINNREKTSKQTLPAVRDLEKWVPDDERAKPSDDPQNLLGQDVTGEAGEWDQFEANKRLREAKGEKAIEAYSDEMYSTKVDQSNFTAEQREQATRLAAVMGESTQDSLADKYANGYDEEDLHSAVQRDGNEQKIASPYVLLCNLGVDIGLTELKELGDAYGKVKQVKSYPVQSLSQKACDILVKRGVILDGDEKPYLIHFATTADARSLVSDLDGQETNGSKCRVCFLYTRDADEAGEYTADTIVSLDESELTLIPPLSSFSTKRKLKQWEAKDATNNFKGESLDEGNAEGWDQFEANKKLGVAESTYSPEFYSTDLGTIPAAQREAAEKLASEMQSTRDSLLAPDGEGDCNDEEARHSAVNDSSVLASATPAPPAATPPKPVVIRAPSTSSAARMTRPAEDTICHVFMRGIGDMTEEEIRELFAEMSVSAEAIHLLPRYRHPVGGAIVTTKNRFIREVLELDGLDLGDVKLLVRLVFPPRYEGKITSAFCKKKIKQ